MRLANEELLEMRIVENSVFTESIYYNHHRRCISVALPVPFSVFLRLWTPLPWFIWKWLRIGSLCKCEQSKSINKLCNFIWCTFLLNAESPPSNGVSTEANCRRRCHISNGWRSEESVRKKKKCLRKPKQCSNSSARLVWDRELFALWQTKRQNESQTHHTHTHTHAHYIFDAGICFDFECLWKFSHCVVVVVVVFDVCLAIKVYVCVCIQIHMRRASGRL